MFRKWMQSAGIAVLLVIAALALSQAGPLEPSAPPGPTMKTLDEIPPTWSLLLPDARRYVVVLGSHGVLDKETGLVWERAPKQSIDPDAFTWTQAQTYCLTKSLGVGLDRRGGWRLPSAAEMASLGVAGNLFIDETPFDGDCSDGFCVTAAYYWTSTTVPASPTDAFVGYPTSDLSTGPKQALISAWCVRGGFGTDAGR